MSADVFIFAVLLVVNALMALAMLLAARTLGQARIAYILAATFGTNVLLYPQATRRHGLEGFRTGVARLAAAAGVPIVPVHVGGSALLMPKGRGLHQRGDTQVAFGPPLYPRAGAERGVAA